MSVNENLFLMLDTFLGDIEQVNIYVRQVTDNKRKIEMKISMTSIFVDEPIKAHGYYTQVLGFESKEFAADAHLAVVVSPEDPNGTALLLEPRGDSFAKTYQESVYKAGLPVIVFGTTDIHTEIEKLKKRGVKFRDDLARPEWGLQNLFEDTFGNLIMIEEISIA